MRRKLLAPLEHSLRVGYDGESWKLTGRKLKVHADLDGAVEQALDDSREGGLPGRLVRYVTGGELDKQVSADVTYSQPAVNRFVRHVAERSRSRSRRTPASKRPATRSKSSPAQDGRKLRDNLLTRQTRRRGPQRRAPTTRSPPAPTPTKPEVTRSEVAAKYPSYLTLDRSTFTLRLWKHLKLAKTYTVAVGMEGLETPEGLYEIQEKEENPSWHVPNSAWAGTSPAR